MANGLEEGCCGLLKTIFQYLQEENEPQRSQYRSLPYAKSPGHEDVRWNGGNAPDMFLIWF